MGTPLVSCVVLSYNSRHLLKDCLDSLLAQTYPGLELIVVDNGSIDGSATFVQEAYPQARVIILENNIGFAAGNNLGVQHSSGDIIGLLNSDVILDRNCIAELIQAMEADDSVAIASPRIMATISEPDYGDWMGTINVLGKRVLQPRMPTNELLLPAGCSFLFRRDLLGLPFDPDYFAYGEDVYISWRAWMQGFRVVHVPDAKVIHLGSVTALAADKREKLFYRCLMERNRLMNLFLFLSVQNLTKIAPMLLLSWLLYPGHRVRIRALLWLARNVRRLVAKRSLIQKLREVGDERILKLMSCKWDFCLRASDIRNKLLYHYCRLLGLRTQEFGQGEPA